VHISSFPDSVNFKITFLSTCSIVLIRAATRLRTGDYLNVSARRGLKQYLPEGRNWDTKRDTHEEEETFGGDMVG